MDTKIKRTCSSFFAQYRLLAFVVLCSIGVTLIVEKHVSLFAHKGTVQTYTYLNPSVNLVHKNDLLVNFEPLRKRLTEKYEKRDDYLVSLYFEYLPTGASININRDERIWPASLIKIPVAMAAMKKVERGTWKLSNELVILDEDKDTEFGDLYKKPTGTTLTIQELLEKSLVDSDNTAHFVLLRNLDSSDLEETYRHLGMDDIVEHLKKSPEEAETDNRMTAKRYTIFFRSLYNATYLSPEYSQVFFDILERAPKEYLNKGMPYDTVFVHKTGIRADEHVWADSGIVYITHRPYLITVMIQKKQTAQNTSEDTANADVGALFEDIGKEIYEYVTTAH